MCNQTEYQFLENNSSEQHYHQTRQKKDLEGDLYKQQKRTESTNNTRALLQQQGTSPPQMESNCRAGLLELTDKD